jgi:hypothetical protein
VPAHVRYASPFQGSSPTHKTPSLRSSRAIIADVRCGFFGKLFVALLLTFCVGAHLVELSDRWDRTLQDANDEAGIVAIVLCVGVALSATGTLLNRMRRSSVTSRIVPASLMFQRPRDPRIVSSFFTSGPPTSLRV